MTELQRIYAQKAQPGESPRTRRMALLEAYLTGEQYAGRWTLVTLNERKHHHGNRNE